MSKRRNAVLDSDESESDEHMKNEFLSLAKKRKGPGGSGQRDSPSKKVSSSSDSSETSDNDDDWTATARSKKAKTKVKKKQKPGKGGKKDSSKVVLKDSSSEGQSDTGGGRLHVSYLPRSSNVTGRNRKKILQCVCV